MKLLRLHFFCCAKGVVRAKSAKCDRGLLLFGSDVQKGSFFNLVSDHGGSTIPGFASVYFSE